MIDLQQHVLEIVRAELGAERLAGAIVYLDGNSIRAGQRVQVGDALIETPWDAHLAFIDLEPRVNWGHACCYLAVRKDSDEVIQVAAHMPPFLKAGNSGFRLLWRGPLAPEWAVAAQDE